MEARPGGAPLTTQAQKREMRAHVREVLSRHGIAGHWDARVARCNKVTREVWMEPIDGPLSYLVALHEIGHLVSGRCRRAQWMHEDEPAAWQWAIRNSRVTLPWWVYGRVDGFLREYGLKP